MAKKPQVIQSFDDSETKDATRQHHTSNTLKLKIDNLKTFDPLTENQRKFFDAYRQGDYFIALLGSPRSEEHTSELQSH